MTAVAGRPVAVLYTGGTFGMVPTPRGLVPHSDLRAKIEALVTDVQDHGGEHLPWTYQETPHAIDSAELGPDGMSDLADRIRSVALDQRPAGIVVVHGTDTMAYSAAHSAFALADLDLPIVFTGAQVPLGAPGSDAGHNFAHAFLTARADAGTGVQIAFGGRLLPAVRATKRSSEKRKAFAAPRRVTAGADRAGRLLSGPLRRAAGRPGPRIGLVKVSPGLTARQLQAVLDDCPAGVVLECYGAGTAPMGSGEVAAAVRQAVDGGTVVLAITQCAHGSVDLGRYAVGSMLADAGAVPGGDMTTEAALGKLGALLRAGFTGDELEELLGRNLLGERAPSGA